ncbi:MAG: potassium channel family protein, partial [Cyclobacteriaceae bacterium]
PQRIIVNSIISIVLFTIIYWYNRDLVVLNNGTPTELSIWDCIYFSSTTFSTLGYGDYSPTGFLRIIAVIESFYGVLNAGFLVAGLSTNKY